METQRNADDGISAESVNEKAKQGGQGKEKLSSCFCCGGDTGKSGSIRPLLIADADQEDNTMRLKDTGLTVQDIKDKVNKYMIETYERFDFLAETAEGMYMYDENGTPYLDFYAGIAVNNAGNRNPKVVAAAKEQLDDIMHTFN